MTKAIKPLTSMGEAEVFEGDEFVGVFFVGDGDVAVPVGLEEVDDFVGMSVGDF